MRETKAEVEHCRYEYAALLSLCDRNLGRVLDFMDAHGLWKDTLLIVNTDHGHMLGEHDHWAKCWNPFYNEVAHTPLFIWDPRSKVRGARRQSLVQNIDWAPTLLEFFGVPRPKDMQGKPLKDVILRDKPVREAGLFGMFSAQVGVTDGRYVYLRSQAGRGSKELYRYTLMPLDMRDVVSAKRMRGTVMRRPFTFTKGSPVMKIPMRTWSRFPTELFDLKNDPGQTRPLKDAAVEKRMIALMKRLMKENDAPKEQFARLGLA